LRICPHIRFPRFQTAFEAEYGEVVAEGELEITIDDHSFATANRSSSLGGKCNDAVLFVVAADLSFAVRRGQAAVAFP